MSDNETVVASLLNSARPRLRDGWEARATGCDEVALRHLAARRYAVLPAAAAPALPLLDGTRTLNQVAAEVMRREGRVRHQVILEAVARLRRAELLEPLAPLEVDRFVCGQAPALAAGRFGRFVRRVACVNLMMPLLWRGRTGHPAQAGLVSRLVWVGIALLWLVAVAATGVRVFGTEQALGQGGTAALPALFWVFVGLVTGATWRELVRAVVLRRLGGALHGVGVRLTAGLPHLAVDARDEVMLARDERLVLRAWTLAAVALLAAGVTGGALAAAWGPLLYLAAGMHLVVFAGLSPLWHSDLAALLEELLGSRRLRRVSTGYLLRKLWRSVVRRGQPGRMEVRLMTLGSLTIVYLFAAALALAKLTPVTVDALGEALLAPTATTGELVFAVAVAAWLWTAFLVAVLAIGTAVVSAAVQLLAPRRTRSRPVQVRHGDALPMDELVAEVRAVPPFAALPEELVRETLAAGRLERYSAGMVILRQGDPGADCCVVRSGHCRVVQEDAAGVSHDLGRLSPGHLFGERALLASEPRAASVLAEDEVELVALSGARFLELVQAGGVDTAAVEEQVRIHLFLTGSELFGGLSSAGMASLLAATRLIRPAAGEAVVTQGDEGRTMYVIYQGRCEVAADGRRVARLGPGDYFGEIALMTGGPRTATVTCLEDCVLLEVPAEIYQGVILREFATGAYLDHEAEARLQMLAVT